MATRKKKARTGRSALYTYRCGVKVPLTKRPDQFVVRRLPEELPTSMAAGEQMSTASTRVTVEPKALEAQMTQARTLAPTHHAYAVAASGADFLITDRVIVSFAQEMTPEQVGSLAGKYALELLEQISPRDYLMRLTDATGMNPVKLVVALTETEDEVYRADHDLNMVFRKYALAPPTDTDYDAQWHLHQRQPEAQDYDHRASSRCEAAWQLLDSFGEPEVVVGVTDDGCQLDHPDFDSPGKFAGWGYFASNQALTLTRQGDAGADPFEMYDVGADHGTACAGVIGADVDAARTVGAAPDVRLAPIKWPSSGPSLFIGDTRLRRALQYLGDRVDIISNSWGRTPTSSWAATTLDLIDELAEQGGRRGRGIVFLWAAGNENCPIDHEADVDVPFTNGWFFDGSSWHWVGVETTRSFSNDLAERPGVLQVAALASTAQRSHYSNYGPGIDLCAPSSNSHTYSRLLLQGRGVTTIEGIDRVVDDFGGTSSATPLVAGIAALVISANPELSAAEVIEILKQTASKDLDLTGYPRTPPASYDPNPAWDVSPIAPFDAGDFQDIGSPDGTWSPWFGHGRVDALAAVTEAMGRGRGQTQRISASATANLAIPDRNPVGVVSGLHVSDGGTVQSLRVHVDITHTWIGDLTVELTGPAGERALLHARQGNNADNIVRTYDSATDASLADFLGSDVRGTWLLRVADHASADVGMLNLWGIEADIAASAVRRFESAPGVIIQDDDPDGVADTITIADATPVSALAVEVDITHRWRGDLTVALTSPAGVSILLHDREGANADNVQRTYTAADVPELGQFAGQSAVGTWTLRCADHEGAIVGKLARWAIELS